MCPSIGSVCHKTSIFTSLMNTNNHGLSRRYDGSHHHEWDLLWARSLIRERHIWWQIWHSKLLVNGEPDLRRSRLASNSWMRRTSNSSTADLHVERQPVLSIASVSSSEGVMLHWVYCNIVVLTIALLLSALYDFASYSASANMDIVIVRFTYLLKTASIASRKTRR